MRPHAWIGRIGLGIGLAAACLAAFVARCAATSTQAAGPDAPLSSTHSAQVVPAWGATEPVTILFTSTQTIRWNLAPYSAVITLPKEIVTTGSFRPSAIFTFTPTSGYTFTAPLTALDRFFELDADYVLDGAASIPPELEAQAVAFNPAALPQIEWQYQDAELLGVQEASLQLGVYWKLFGIEGWNPQPGTVYPDRNQAAFELSRVGLYGFSGYRGQLYLPLVLKNN